MLRVLQPLAIFLLLHKAGHYPWWIAAGGAVLIALPLFWPERRFRPYWVRIKVDLPWTLSILGLVDIRRLEEVKQKVEENAEQFYCGQIATDGIKGYVLSCNAEDHQAVHWPKGPVLYTGDIALEVPIDLLPPEVGSYRMRYPWIFVKRRGRAYHIGVRVKRSWWENLGKGLVTETSIVHTENHPEADEVELSLALIPDFYFAPYRPDKWWTFYNREKLERRSKTEVQLRGENFVSVGNDFVSMLIAELPSSATRRAAQEAFNLYTQEMEKKGNDRKSAEDAPLQSYEPPRF